MVAIRLMRMGTKKKPFYRIVAVDRERPRQSAYIDLIGHYDPKKKPAQVNIDKAKYDEWVKKGARPSETVKSLLKQVKSDI